MHFTPGQVPKTGVQVQQPVISVFAVCLSVRVKDGVLTLIENNRWMTRKPNTDSMKESHKNQT